MNIKLTLERKNMKEDKYLGEFRAAIDKSLADFSKTLVDQNLSFNEKIMVEQKGLIKLQEPTLFVTKQSASAAGGTEIIYTALEDIRLLWASIQTQTAAILKLSIIHGSTINILLTGFGGTGIYHERDFGKHGIAFKAGDSLGLVVTSSQTYHVMANFAGPSKTVIVG
jgi:hypothetical protein